MIAAKNYIKGLIKLSLLTFIILCIGLYFIGISNWGIKAFFIALVDIMPVLGSGMVMIPWAIYRAVTGSVDIGAQIAILYVILIVIRFIAEPLLVGKTVGVSPLLTLGATIIGTIIFGPIGAVLAGLLTVPAKVVWDIYSGRSIYSTSEDKDKRRFRFRRKN